MAIGLGTWPCIRKVTIESSSGNMSCCTKCNVYGELNCYRKGTVEHTSSNGWLTRVIKICDQNLECLVFQETLVSLTILIMFESLTANWTCRVLYIEVQKRYYDCFYSALLLVPLNIVSCIVFYYTA